MTKTDLQSVIQALKDQAQKTPASYSCEMTNGVPCWMRHDHKTVCPIGEEQAVSLAAMVAYVAHRTGQSEFRVEREFTNRFCIPNLKCLPNELYDNAIRYMVDQVPTARCS
ncbi:MAG TPA: hypothetical protein DCY07_04350 [Rhodospirillaceae bacterium]|nr:hypothetical protein [Rhodospirillaceae bacterium]